MTEQLPQNVDVQLTSVISPRIVIYNASEEELDNQVSGHIFRCMPGATIEIRGIEDFPVNQTVGSLRQGRREMNMAKIIVMEADKVARHLLLVSGWYERGATPIFGNEAIDGPAKEAARNRYIKSRVARAMVTQTHWLSVVNETQKVPGSLPPIMPENIRIELDFLNRHQAQVLRGERKRYICSVDGWQSDNLEEITKYVVDHYPDHIRDKGFGDPSVLIHDLEAQAKGIQAQFAAQRAKALREAGSGGHVQQEEDVTGFLIEKAEKLGINLTKADYRGLATHDREVIATLTERLARKEAGSVQETPNA